MGSEGLSETQDEDKRSRGTIGRMLATKEFLEDTRMTSMSGETGAGEDATVSRVCGQAAQGASESSCLVSRVRL